MPLKNSNKPFGKLIQRDDLGWRLFFLTGLLLGPPSTRPVDADLTNIRIGTPLSVLAIAGRVKLIWPHGVLYYVLATELTWL